MRRKDKELTDIRQAEDILNMGRLCHIAMANGDEPYLVTVNYGYKSGCIYFHSAPEGRKIEMIRNNPNVCFMIYSDDLLVPGENPCKDWSMKYRSVIGYGKATILKNHVEKTEGLNILMEHYSKKGPFKFGAKNLEETTVVKIDIENISGKISGY
jgi:nitroimidazol reductase NimA-like FMN-containing flavoprotein (pyridoxamine 5'-phosphate oxidase superfamily)